MPHVLDVDAGNTKTVALVALLDGTIVGSGRAGCGDIYGAVSEAAALTEVTSAVGSTPVKCGWVRKGLNKAGSCGIFSGRNDQITAGEAPADEPAEPILPQPELPSKRQGG